MRKISAYQRTSSNRYQSVKSWQRDIFGQITAYKLSFARYLALSEEMRASNDYRKLTEAQRFALSELAGAFQDELHRYHLTWALGTADGRIISRGPGDPWTEELSQFARTPGALFGANVWRGSDELYSEWKATN